MLTCGRDFGVAKFQYVFNKTLRWVIFMLSQNKIKVVQMLIVRRELVL